MVESQRESYRKVEQEACYCITSPTLPAQTIDPMICDHRAVENSLHWVMDMVSRDNECRFRTENASANFVTLKHMALDLTRKAP